MITVHAVVPLAAYAGAFNHTPVRQEDGSWLWTCTVGVGTNNYTAELFAGTDVEGINWQMYLSKSGENAFTDFLWYEGEHDLLMTEGTWTLYKSPTDTVEYIGITWHRNPTTETGDIKYTNIEPGGSEYGGLITYGTTIDTVYDAYYDVFMAGDEHYIDIDWNITSQAGRVLDSTHFEDDQWHCWDEDLSDTSCE